jgi:hypothetical protein
MKTDFRAVHCEPWNGVAWLWRTHLEMKLVFHDYRLFLHELSNYQVLKGTLCHASQQNPAPSNACNKQLKFMSLRI